MIILKMIINEHCVSMTLNMPLSGTAQETHSRNQLFTQHLSTNQGKNKKSIGKGQTGSILFYDHGLSVTHIC